MLTALREFWKGWEVDDWLGPTWDLFRRLLIVALCVGAFACLNWLGEQKAKYARISQDRFSLNSDRFKEVVDEKMGKHSDEDWIEKAADELRGETFASRDELSETLKAHMRAHVVIASPSQSGVVSLYDVRRILFENYHTRLANLPTRATELLSEKATNKETSDEVNALRDRATADLHTDLETAEAEAANTLERSYLVFVAPTLAESSAGSSAVVVDAKKDEFIHQFLDEQNDSYVLYLVFWYAALVIGVLGVAYLILALLRLLPFPDGVEALKKRVESLLEREPEKVAGEIAARAAVTRPLIAAVGALGLGAAVTIGATANAKANRALDGVSSLVPPPITSVAPPQTDGDSGEKSAPPDLQKLAVEIGENVSNNLKSQMGDLGAMRTALTDVQNLVRPALAPIPGTGPSLFKNLDDVATKAEKAATAASDAYHEVAPPDSNNPDEKTLSSVVHALRETVGEQTDGSDKHTLYQTVHELDERVGASGRAGSLFEKTEDIAATLGSYEKQPAGAAATQTLVGAVDSLRTSVGTPSATASFDPSRDSILARTAAIAGSTGEIKATVTDTRTHLGVPAPGTTVSDGVGALYTRPETRGFGGFVRRVFTRPRYRVTSYAINRVAVVSNGRDHYSEVMEALRRYGAEYAGDVRGQKEKAFRDSFVPYLTEVLAEHGDGANAYGIYMSFEPDLLESTLQR